jgi:RNA recognition motif-containing protein
VIKPGSVELEHNKSSLKRKFFVGGIPPEAREVDLVMAFAQYELAEYCIMKNPHNGNSRGFGFVTLKDKNAAKTLLARLATAPIVIMGKTVWLVIIYL